MYRVKILSLAALSEAQSLFQIKGDELSLAHMALVNLDC